MNSTDLLSSWESIEQLPFLIIICGVNNMLILKKLHRFTVVLGVHRATSIQTFDFSTLYTSIPHDLLKSRMNNIINNAFKHKNGAT